MLALAIPLIAFLVLLVTALLVSRRQLSHPSVVLYTEYVVIAAFSVVYGVMTDAWVSFPDDALGSSILLVFLISASLVPSCLVKKPNLDLTLIRQHLGRATFGLTAIAGTVGFVCMLPGLIKSLSMDAYTVKFLGTSSLVDTGPYTIVGSFSGAFSCVFGLLLYGDTKFELSWLVRIGLLLGFLNYGVLGECNKDRNMIVYYPMYLVFYFWLYSHKWGRRMKVFYYTTLVCGVALGGALFTVKTLQRFGDQDAHNSVVDGTVGYLGQQVANFVEVAGDAKPIEGIGQICFPVYFYLQTGTWVDVSELLMQRTSRVEFVFSTYVGTLFLAVGRQCTVAGLLVFAMIAAAFFHTPMKQCPVTYALGIMLYYQMLFQGAFYFMQIGRSGNGFVICMVCMCIATYRIPGSGVARGM